MKSRRESRGWHTRYWLKRDQQHRYVTTCRCTYGRFSQICFHVIIVLFCTCIPKIDVCMGYFFTMQYCICRMFVHPLTWIANEIITKSGHVLHIKMSNTLMLKTLCIFCIVANVYFLKKNRYLVHHFCTVIDLFLWESVLFASSETCIMR